MIHFQMRMYIGSRSGVTSGMLDHVVQGCTQGEGGCQAAPPPQKKTELKKHFIDMTI